MADAGSTDIFLPYNILGEQNSRGCGRWRSACRSRSPLDSEATLEGLAATFRDASSRSRVLIECDTGMGRCGVQSPAEALGLARRIANTKGLVFKGLMTYPAAGSRRGQCRLAGGGGRAAGGGGPARRSRL